VEPAPEEQARSRPTRTRKRRGGAREAISFLSLAFPALVALVTFLILPRALHTNAFDEALVCAWGLAMGLAISIGRYNKGRDPLARITMRTILRRRLHGAAPRQPQGDTGGVGLDIGSTRLRAACVKDGSLLGLVERPLPPGIISGGLVRDGARLASEISALRRDAGFPMAEVNFGVANRQVTMRLMSLAATVEETDVKLAIDSNADAVLAPMDVSGATVGYHELSRTGQRRTFQLAAAEREMASAFSGALERAGVRRASCEIAPLAEARSLVIPREAKAAHLVIDIGDGTTTIILASGPDVLFERIVPFGGHDFTQAVSRGLSCTMEEAEGLKARAGLEIVPADESLRGDERLALIQRSLQLMADRLAQVVEEALRAYSSEPEARVVTGLTLLGGGSRLKGLSTQMAGLLRLPVTPPVPRPGISLEGDLDLYATAIGLAIGGQMNLAPRTSAQRRSESFLRLMGLGVRR
jgi:type IV pilus assembly protein PilM